MSALAGLDEARLEWEFEHLRREHAECCTGALLFYPETGSPTWINVLLPVDSPDYRSFGTAE